MQLRETLGQRFVAGSSSPQARARTPTTTASTSCPLTDCGRQHSPPPNSDKPVSIPLDVVGLGCDGPDVVGNVHVAFRRSWATSTVRSRHTDRRAALPPLRHPDPPRTLHEPLVVLMPPLPATNTGTEALTRARCTNQPSHLSAKTHHVCTVAPIRFGSPAWVRTEAGGSVLDRRHALVHLRRPPPRVAHRPTVDASTHRHRTVTSPIAVAWARARPTGSPRRLRCVASAL